MLSDPRERWRIPLLTLIATAFLGVTQANATSAPEYKVDPTWPKPLPNNWLLGQVAGIAVDGDDNVWILQRPRTLTDDEAGATDAMPGVFVCEPGGENVGFGGMCPGGAAPVPADAFGHPRPNGPISDCCIPAPAVLQFDAEGNLLQAWGGPEHRDPSWNWPASTCDADAVNEAERCQWPANEHGIFVDHNNNVYIGGNGFGDGQTGSALNDRGWDGQILKFASDGTFLLQVGAAGFTGPASNEMDGGLNDTPQLWRPADSEVDPETNELYVADGYGNHRVVVVDAATGQYERHWGAYGQRPVDDAAANAVGPFADDRQDVLDGVDTPAHFRNPVHCVRIARDGLVYVCDRVNNRIQVFSKDDVGAVCDNDEDKLEGQCGFVMEKFVRADTLGPGSVWDLDTSSDRQESCLHNVDGSNQHLDTFFRQTLEKLDSFGVNGRLAAQFHWVHNLAVDSKGTIYTAEVDTGKRAQKFERHGSRNCRL